LVQQGEAHRCTLVRKPAELLINYFEIGSEYFRSFVTKSDVVALQKTAPDVFESLARSTSAVIKAAACESHFFE
jgi:hypothetical protein